jgi:hypothetical protein
LLIKFANDEEGLEGAANKLKVLKLWNAPKRLKTL